MKSITAILLGLLPPLSFAAAIQGRQESTEFSVAGLNFGCVPHSSYCYYALNVTTTPSLPVFQCSASALSYQTVPALSPTACQDPNVSISYSFVEGGADLVINWAYAAGRNLTGTRFVPSSEVIYTNTEIPTGMVQVYDGETDFTITDLQQVAVA